MSRRSLFRVAVVIAFFFALGFTYQYHLPQIESYLLVKIEDLAARKTPLRIVPQRLRLTLFPLGVALEQVQITPRGDLNKILAPARLEEVAATLSLLPLIRGEIRLSRVVIRNSEVTLFLNSTKKTGAPPNAKSGFKLEDLREIPIDEVQLENITFMGRVDPQAMVFKLHAVDLDVVNLYNSLYLSFNSPSLEFKPAGPYPTLNLEAEVRGLLDAGELRVSALKLKSDKSFLVASGLLNGQVLTGKIESGHLKARTHLELLDVTQWERVFPMQTKLPRLGGSVDLNADLAYKGDVKIPELHYVLETKNLLIDKFQIGDITSQGIADPEKLTTPELLIQNSAGAVALGNLKAEFKPIFKFRGDLDIRKMELRQLLEDLDIRAPLHLDFEGKAPCEGTWAEHIDVKCDGELRGRNLVVTNPSGKKTIVKENEFSGKGQVFFDEQKLRFQVDAALGKNTKGRTTGFVDYDKGFKINFETPRLDFGDIANLVDLKVEGAASIKGSTEGDAHRGSVQIDLQSKDFWFEDFGIGEMSTSLTYKSGHLLLQKIDGIYGVSRYNGNIDVDLLKDQITAQAKLPFVELKDLKSLLQRRLPIPVEIKGTGAGNIQVWGPLNIEKLNYLAQNEFYRGKIAGEDFDLLHFDVEGVNGVANAKRVLMTKSNGQLELRGLIRPAWTVDAVLVGRGLRLEQSDLVNSLGFDLQGQSDFNFLIRGPIKKPRMDLNGRLSKVIIADSPQDDSVFHLDFASDRMSGNGQFLGNKLQTQFTLPLEPTAPFDFQLKTTNWDFSNLFALVAKSAHQMDFQTGLTMDAKLHADEGGFWKSSGLVEVSNLRIRHAAESMESNGPMKLIFNKGSITSDNFAITAGENFLKLHMVALTRDHLNADLSGKMNLSLVGLLTPFISDLRGNVALSVDVKGTTDNPLLSGSTFIDKAYIKLRDFPHPFSNLRADLLFNQQSLMINALRSDLGGGKLTAQGKIAYLAHDHVPVDIIGNFNDVAINFPDNFKTHGDGTVGIHGDKFPYVLQINYDIQGGDITSEFASSNSNSNIKASPYLPKSAQAETFEPFRYDINIALKKPVNVYNALMRAQVQGQVQVKGTPDQLRLNGSFAPLPGGKVFFRDQPFDITTGYVEYTNFPPENPRIYLTATAHVTETVTDQQHLGDQQAQQQSSARQIENQYDISLMVQGRAQPLPQFTLNSQPPLSQRDIVSLLALGMTSEALDERKSGGSSANTAIGAALLQQPVGKKLKESLGVDVKVSSTQPTPDNAAAPMVTFSKQWSPKFSASASSTLGGGNQMNGVKIEYKVNHNVSAIGSWEDGERSSLLLEDKKDVSSSIFGLDLEYKVQFK